MSVSTIKRAELGKPVSFTTLKKYSKLLGLTQDEMIIPPSCPSSVEQIPEGIHFSTIDWFAALNLTGSDIAREIAFLSRSLFFLISEYPEEKNIQSAFRRHKLSSSAVKMIE